MVALGLLVAGCASAPGTLGSPSPPSTASPSVSPSTSAPTTSYPAATGIRVPAGFTAQVFARGLAHPTALAFGPDGRLYVAEQGGEIVTVAPNSASPAAFANGYPTPLGLAWLGQTLFIAAQGQLDSLELAGTSAAAPTRVLTGLPFGEHQQDGIAIGPNGRLYLGSGSTCDVCTESSPYSAAVLSVNPNGSDLQVFASGLRNPYALAFQPGTGRLYADVNGQDNLGGPFDPEPADMLVHIQLGANYGWPRCWPNARHLTMDGQCQGVTQPATYLPPHAAPTGMVFYTGGSFPAADRGALFIAEYGSSFSYDRTGHDVEEVRLGPDGTAPISAVTVFATGFRHPTAIVADPSGALLVADYGTGIIYRIQAKGRQ